MRKVTIWRGSEDVVRSAQKGTVTVVRAVDHGSVGRDDHFLGIGVNSTEDVVSHVVGTNDFVLFSVMSVEVDVSDKFPLAYMGRR